MKTRDADIIRATENGHPPPSPMNAFLVAMATTKAHPHTAPPPAPAGFAEARRVAKATVEEIGLNPHANDGTMLIALLIEHSTTN